MGVAGENCRARAAVVNEDRSRRKTKGIRDMQEIRLTRAERPSWLPAWPAKRSILAGPTGLERGLAGGGTTGNVLIGIAPSGITSALLADGSVHRTTRNAYDCPPAA